MELMVTALIFTIVVIVIGIGLFFFFSKINLIRYYALFLSVFVTVCVLLSLLHVQSTPLPPEFSIVPARPAELRGFPLSIITTATLDGQTSTYGTGWRGANIFWDYVFYFLIGLVLVGIYAVIKKTFTRAQIKKRN